MVKFITMNDLKSWRRKACFLAELGGIGFIIITLIAMIFYPGGYSFFGNYFSDLGTFYVDGIPNPVSRVLFIIACTWAGLSLILFWIPLITLFKQDKKTKIISSIGSVLGLISSPFLILLSVYGYDLFPSEHFYTTMLYFLFFALAILVYTLAILINKEYPHRKLSGIVSSVFSIILIFYVFSFFRVYSFGVFGALVQKLIVYGLILWTAFQIIVIWKKIED